MLEIEKLAQFLNLCANLGKEEYYFQILKVGRGICHEYQNHPFSQPNLMWLQNMLMVLSASEKS